ncbi:DinB family protein [uncultured Chitinophaga sp.]|uniref:DinB family protein n=1 Tax=uncultured Chitinophaga sp. TaxID=339340 RepID=UPI0025EF21FB|nr:DinB family protein [uncultured Chitinophaga sp.]
MENTQLSRFCQTIDLWISFLPDYSMEQLSKRPHAGAWSLGQVYKHLVIDTGFFAEQMQLALTAGNADEHMHPHAITIFANNSFPDEPQANPYNDINMPQPGSKEELAKALIAIKNDVLQLEFDGRTSGKTKHPGLGYFTAQEWLQFADMHMRHHLRQKRDIDAALGNTTLSH